MGISHVEYIDNLGTIRIQKKRGLKRISMRLHPSGEIRVSQPFYLPYSAGLQFAKSQADWVKVQRQKHTPIEITNGMQIGKRHALHLVVADKLSSRVSKNMIIIQAPAASIESGSGEYITVAKKAIKRALQKEAAEILPERLTFLAKDYGYIYKEVKTKPMKTRWGSCSHDKTIVLNCYLMMLPWEIIDYVLMHELAHTKHMSHGSSFWEEVAKTTPDYKNIKKQLKELQPKIHVFYV